MRTIKVELVAPLLDETAGLAAVFGGGSRIHISTEAVVSDDGDCREAGREAREAVDSFIEGYQEQEANS